jgi:hypothetical protein
VYFPHAQHDTGAPRDIHTSSLIIINEHNKTIAEILDGINLKCTFCRCVDIRLFNMWEQVISAASTLVLSKEEDELIWWFNSFGVYSSQSLYNVINF